MSFPSGYAISSIQNTNAGEGSGDASHGHKPTEVPGGAGPAWGFALYMAIDEMAAQSAGTSLCGLVKDIRDFGHDLLPGLDSHAVVSVGPPTADGRPIERVFAAFGDPSPVARSRHERVAPQGIGARSGRGAAHSRRPKDAPASGVVIDVSGRKVYLDGDSVHLTVKEFQLMTYLIDNRARVVGRTELLQHVWGCADGFPNERAVDVHIRRLRHKLGRLAKTIQTQRGAGYQFHGHPEVTVCSAPEFMI